MTAAGSDPIPASPDRPGRAWRVRLLLLLVFVLVLGVAGGLGWYYFRHAPGKTEPPMVDLSSADPEVATAITAAREDVCARPRSDLAWGNLGTVLAAHGYEHLADPCFAEAARLQPQEARWAYFRGLTLLYSDSNEALVQFQQAVRLQGDAPALRLRLGEALVAHGRLDEAEEQLRPVLGDATLAPRAQLGLARVCYQRGQLDQARTWLVECGGHPLARKAATNLLAEIDQRANDPAAAAQARARAAELPEDQDWSDPFLEDIEHAKVGRNARLNYGLQLVREHRSAEADTLFRALVSKYPDWDQVWLTYGRFHLDNRNYVPAEDALRKAVQLAPDSVAGHFYLGVTLFQRQFLADATTHFREVVRLKPDHALAAWNLGTCLKLQNDPSGALEAFRAAVGNNPGLAGAHISMGKLLAEMGRKTEAIEELRIGLELRPEDADTRKLLEQLREGK
jgi:tetratricopeptide (TPR) repeat protein